LQPFDEIFLKKSRQMIAVASENNKAAVQHDVYFLFKKPILFN